MTLACSIVLYMRLIVKYCFIYEALQRIPKLGCFCDTSPELSFDPPRRPFSFCGPNYMALILKRPESKYWIAAFTAVDGRRLKRSTRETDRRTAQKIADGFEEVARRKRTVAHSRRVLADIHKAITGEPLMTSTVRLHFAQWLAVKKNETTPATMTFYRSTLDRFVAWLGERADAPLDEIGANDVRGYINERRGKVAPATANHELKSLRTVFKAARRDGLITDDPSEHIDTVKQRSRQRETRPFTIPELKAILAAADEEWRSMVLCALYTGQRLGDISALTWEQVDLVAGEIRLTTRKTGKRLIIPMAPPLRAHLESLPSSDNSGTPLHPRAFKYLSETGRTGDLSRQFGDLLGAAGLRQKIAHRKKDGADGRHSRHSISFHALRRTATTMLHEAGVPAAVVQSLIGHDSPDVHAVYVSIGREALVKAANSLPNIPG